MYVFAAFAAIVVGLGAYTFYFSRSARIKRRLREVAEVSIAKAEDGQPVRIRGRLELLPDVTPLRSPVSGRECAAYEVRVFQDKGDNTETVLTHHESINFQLRDDTGVATVDGTLLDMLVQVDREGRTGMFKGKLPEGLRALLETKGIDTKGVFFQKAFTYSEGVFEPGEEIVVAGMGRWERDPTQPGQGYRGTGRRLVITPLDDGMLPASDYAS
ncbi:MAG: hypothetical protein AAF411_27800 [Myxococcota bacterium]